MDNNIKYYLLFNPDLKKLNINQLKESYINDLKTNNRITSINSFFKKYPDFNINDYKKDNFTMIETLVDYHLNNNNKNDNNNNNNTTNIPDLLNEKESTIKLAHIFIHFFKIGGGECYLSTFNKYNKESNTFDETLFINKRSETLFEYNGKVVYYNDYNELNKLLDGFDIILDHQLYWFEENVSIEAFNNIPPNKIIRVIHGVPIHFKDITTLNFYYSIELYTERLSDKSWSNHIKIYNNIGVKNNFITGRSRKFNEKDIHVAIVGRINPYKIPITFLKLLYDFCNDNSQSQYFFNFYGEIDDSYKNYFYKEMKKNRRAIYHGIIDPKIIETIYINNDILLHPSKSEAGATVVLEAMSHGLPVICRNIGGLPNAVGNNNFLSNDEEDMFKQLLNINIDNYNRISKENRIKIKNENDEKIQTIKLINEIKNIYDIELENSDIPNTIHYVFGLKEQIEEFPFVYYLSILSNVLINKPISIYFHYQYLPHGYWWDKAKPYLKLNYINTDNTYFGDKRVLKYAHKADKIRLEMLLKYGGVYMDIDTITYKPYHHLLKYDFCIGIQEKIYKEKRVEILYCNAILFSKRNNAFLKSWIDEYSTYFDPDGWCEASVHLPSIIYKNLEKEQKINIKILEKEAFYIPSYTNVHKIFEGDHPINNNLLTLHFWNTYSEKYYKDINDFNWALNNNSLYAKLMNNIIKLVQK